MLQALITFAAETAGEEEGSQTLFYIAGGILTVFAVIVSAVGITRPSFPSGDGAKRGVIALGALLVAITMASAIITS